MDKTPHKKTVILSPKIPSTSSERLSAQERVTVAERLLNDISVNPLYLEDIVQCVAGMIPDMDAEARFIFAEKIYTFITNSGHFNGKETFKVFHESVLGSLNDKEKQSLAELFCTGLTANHVTSCEAHLWGLVSVMPHLPVLAHEKYFNVILKLMQHSSLQDMIFSAVTQLFFNLKFYERVHFAHFVMRRLQENKNSDDQKFLLALLSVVTPALNEPEKIMIADTVAPFLFSLNLPIARRALDYFVRNLGVLPANQRYTYILMVSGLMNEVSMMTEAREALEVMSKMLTTSPEKKYVTMILNKDRSSSLEESEEIDEALSMDPPCDRLESLLFDPEAD